MYNTFIFDLDGTLLDTLQDLANSVNFALRKHHMPEHSIDDIRCFVGNGVRLLMERAVPDGAANPDFLATFATFRQHYMVHSLDTTRPYDGIPELIHKLTQRGCQLAVVSNKMMAATQELIAHFFPEIKVAIGEHEAEPYNNWELQRPCTLATVMSILKRLAMLVCPVSASFGVSATVTSCWLMVLRLLWRGLQTSSPFQWHNLITCKNKGDPVSRQDPPSELL